MARKGLDYVAFAKYSYLNGTTTYSQGAKLSTAVGFNVNLNNSVVNDYGDNRVVETVSEVTGGDVSVELNNDDAALYAFLVGATVTENQGKTTIVSNANDEPPLVGAAAIGKTGNVWRLKIYKKCQFSEPNDENATKQESVTFTHTTLSGRMIVPEDGEWRIMEDYSTLADAIAAVEALFHIQ